MYEFNMQSDVSAPVPWPTGLAGFAVRGCHLVLRPAGDISPFNGWLVSFYTSNLTLGPIWLGGDVANNTHTSGIWCAAS
jgi:hypothetical protein